MMDPVLGHSKSPNLDAGSKAIARAQVTRMLECLVVQLKALLPLVSHTGPALQLHPAAFLLVGVEMPLVHALLTAPLGLGAVRAERAETAKVKSSLTAAVSGFVAGSEGPTSEAPAAASTAPLQYLSLLQSTAEHEKEVMESTHVHNLFKQFHAVACPCIRSPLTALPFSSCASCACPHHPRLTPVIAPGA